MIHLIHGVSMESLDSGRVLLLTVGLFVSVVLLTFSRGKS